jgi:hypothetical protein
MVQAARSGKQNIVEGFADGVTSTEMELKLLNVGRASFRELREDYADFLKARTLPVWNAGHPRYDAMLAFCRDHNDLKDYQPLFGKMDAEALLCFQLPFNSSGVVVQVPSTATVHVQEKRTGRPSGLEYRIVIAPVLLSFERA